MRTRRFGVHTTFLWTRPPEVDRMWGIWGSYYNIPDAIVYLLNGDCQSVGTSNTVTLLQVRDVQNQPAEQKA